MEYCWPVRTAVLGRSASTAPVTRPSLISRWSCERDSSGRTAVRKLSSRVTVVFGVDFDGAGSWH